MHLRLVQRAPPSHRQPGVRTTRSWSRAHTLSADPGSHPRASQGHQRKDPTPPGLGAAVRLVV